MPNEGTSECLMVLAVEAYGVRFDKVGCHLAVVIRHDRRGNDCVDQELPCSCEGLRKTQDFCAGANGCPTSPSGFGMICYDPGTAGGGVCVGVNLPGSSASSGQLSCWR